MTPTVAFDVDDTLIYEKRGPHGKPRYEVIALFRAFERLGYNMVIWSRAGAEHAKQCGQSLDLEAEYLDKGTMFPDIAIDDHERELGRITLNV